MKTLLLTCITLGLASSGMAAKPAIDVVRAAKLASDFLAQQGAGAPYIVSITMDEGAIIRGETSWVVRWSKPIVSDGSTEVGVRVKGDGTVVRLVEGKGTRSKRQPAALEIR
jgi:hypothetical protein